MNHHNCTEKRNSGPTGLLFRLWLVSARLFLGLVAAVYCVTASAQSSGAQGISVGETELVPSIGLNFLSIDNLYREATDEVAATGFSLQPGLAWKAQRRLLAIEASYQGEFATFTEDGVNYDDHNLRFTVGSDISSKQRLSGTIGIAKTHEDQGTGQTSLLSDRQAEQIETTSLLGQIAYEYGARSAKGNVRVGLRFGAVDYSNLEELTDGDDQSSIRPFGIFSYRLSPDTRVLVEFRAGSVDFDDDLRDRSELAFLTGIEYGTTSKLGGRALIGVLKADFDDQGVDDTTELIAEVGLSYLPTTFSRFDLTYNRQLETVDDSVLNAGQSVRDIGRLVWTHDWSARFQTLANVSLDNTDRECPSTDVQVVGAGVELNFEIRRWLKFGLSGDMNSQAVSACTDQANTGDSLDYDWTQFGVHIRATL